MALTGLLPAILLLLLLNDAFLTEFITNNLALEKYAQRMGILCFSEHYFNDWHLTFIRKR